MRPRAYLDAFFPVETRSPDETLALGRTLAEKLVPGDIVALYGNLGAGKTVFVRGICSGLGIDASSVTSPTFTILHEYGDARGRGGGAMPVYHFDAYRIEHVDEFYGIGYDEYFFGEGVSLVEWAEKIETLLPDHAIRIRIDHAGGDLRRLRRVIQDDKRPSVPENS